MKASKTIKRSVLNAAAIILIVAFIASCATTYTFAASPDATICQYQVTMNGNLNLRFIYSSVDEGVSFTATVGGKAVDPKITKDGTSTIVSVPVAPSDAAKEVVVSTQGTTQSYSIAEYAKKVLADASLAEWHAMLAALINWCNHSNAYFDETPTAIDGVFTKSTDPISAVNQDTINVPEHGANTATGQLSLKLDEGNVSLLFKIDNATSNADSLTATVMRDGMENAEVNTYKEGSYHVVEINNITTSLFSKVYTVELADGSNTLTAYASVLEYLDLIIEGRAENPSEKQIAVAKALYQFYQLTTDNTDPACTHMGADSPLLNFWVKTGDMHSCRCSYCYKELEAVPNTVIDRHVSADMIAKPIERAYNDSTASAPTLNDITPSRFFNAENGELKYDNDNNVLYYSFGSGNKGGRVVNRIWNRAVNDGNTEWVGDGPFYNIDVGDIKYAVIKLRASKEYIANTDNKVRIDISTSNGAGLSRAAMPLTMLDGGEWVTFIVDLTKIYNTTTNTYRVDNGKYIIDSLVLVDDFTGTPNETLDLASITFASNMAQVAQVVDTDKVIKVAEKYTANTVAAKDGAVELTLCSEEHELEYAYADVATYVMKCKSCLYIDSANKVAGAVTGYIGADHIYTRIVDKYPDDNISDPWYQRIDRFNAKSIKTDDVTCENGYISTTVSINYDQEIIWNKEESSGTSYVNRVLDAGTARFLVIRMRVNSDGNGQNIFNFYLSTEGGARKSTRIPYKSENKGKWVTYVFDMSEGLINSDNTTYTDWLTTTDDGRYVFDEIWIKFNQNAKVDIEYMAFIRGDWKNVAAFTGEETVVKLTHMYGENSVVVNSSTGIDVALTPEEE